MERIVKIAAGRYLQGHGTLSRAGEEVAALGRRALVIGGETAMRQAGGALLASLERAGVAFSTWANNGFCTRERIAALAERAQAERSDVMVGVGGGICMDLAKGVADRCALPIVTVPTVAATCAALTPFSVLYDAEGRSAGSKYYDHPVDVCVADLDILAKAPARTLAAGIVDSLAKSVEISSGSVGLSLDGADMGIYTAYRLGLHIADVLFDRGPKAYAARTAGRSDEAIDEAVFMILAVTGACSGFAEGSKQLAIAHSFNSAARTLFTSQANRFLHGETVGVGILLQIGFNGMPEGSRYRDLMRALHMPVCLADLGIPASAGNLKAIAGYIAEAMGEAFQERDRLLAAMAWIAEGRTMPNEEGDHEG